MPIIAVVVGFIGSAIGGAVAGALFSGTIAGVAAATIGSAIGAGIAGGILAKSQGGSFGKGFLMGAAGGAIGGVMKGAFDGLFQGSDAIAAGATQAADGTTDAMMYASQGGADFAPTALEGVGQVAGAAPVSVGLGDLNTQVSYDGMPSAVEGAPSGDLSSITSQAAQGTTPSDTGFSLSGMQGDLYGATQVPASADSYGSFAQGQAPQMSSLDQTISGTGTTPSVSSYGEPAATPATPSPLENVGNAPPATDTGAAPPLNTSVTSDGGTPPSALSNMWDTAKDTWNSNMPSGSLAKLALGGADYLQKNYEAHKLDRINKGMKPLTFEEYKQQYAPEDAMRYSAASNQMARSGHTGTLPILMAQMNQKANAGYQSYLPNAQQKYLQNTASLGQGKTGTLSNLFKGFAGA
jgi:hypothetical protein